MQRKNICPESPETVYCGDVRKLDIQKLGKITAFCYGFPCNSFSNVGKHQGFENEKFGQLYWYGIEVLKAYLKKYGLKGGFVRFDKNSDELCICTDNYSDDITSDSWKLLEEVF